MPGGGLVICLCASGSLYTEHLRKRKRHECKFANTISKDCHFTD